MNYIELGCEISNMVGPRKQVFWPQIIILEGKNLEIVLSKSIFDIKNQWIFFHIRILI